MQNLKKCKILITLVFCLCCAIISPSAFAHKVNIFAYVQGDIVYTESYFPDGKKVQGGIIEVYDSQGKKVLQGLTDNKGQFSFKPANKEDLKIIINASMGHRNSYLLSADEFQDNNIEQLRGIIETSLDRRLQPIMRKLTRLEQKKLSFVEVMGGIGYIFGIAGAALYFLSKKRV